MDLKSIQQRIKELKEGIAKDERMMIEEPNSMFWWEDYSFNNSLLEVYEKKLKESNK